MVPLVDIFDDIKKELGAQEIRLPESTSEIEKMLLFPGMYTSNPINSITKVPPVNHLAENHIVDSTQHSSSAPDTNRCRNCNSSQHLEASCPQGAHTINLGASTQQTALIGTPPSQDKQGSSGQCPYCRVYVIGRVKEDEQYRWVCHECGGDNSYTYSPNCTNGYCNHRLHVWNYT
jgi:hypothetical protein